MKNWWDNLIKKEQLYLLVGTTVLASYLIFIMVYQPLEKAASQGAQQLREKKETLAWLQLQKKGNDATQFPSIGDDNSFLSNIEKELNQPEFNNYPHALNQNSSREIALKFSEVPYSRFILWLWNISSHYKVRIKQCKITATASQGIVAVSVIFEIIT